VNKGQAAFHTYTTLSRCLAALPEPVAMGMAAVAADVLFRVGGNPRRTVTNNLRRVLDSDGADTALLDRWARRSYRAYARYWVEGARLGTTSPLEVEARTLAQGLEYLVDGMATGKGVIMALPHVGSWEFGGAFLATQGLPMTAVAERVEPPELFEFMMAQREAMGLIVVPLDESTPSAIMATLRNGGLVGLLSDRDLTGKGIDVEFFGEKATMPAGPATLALRSGAALVTGAVYSGPGADHRAVVQPPLDTTRHGSFRADVTRLTQAIATRFEGLIRQAPEQWHVFQPLWSVDRSDGAA